MHKCEARLLHNTTSCHIVCAWEIVAIKRGRRSLRSPNKPLLPRFALLQLLSTVLVGAEFRTSPPPCSLCVRRGVCKQWPGYILTAKTATGYQQRTSRIASPRRLGVLFCAVLRLGGEERLFLWHRPGISHPSQLTRYASCSYVNADNEGRRSSLPWPQTFLRARTPSLSAHSHNTLNCFS